MWGFILPNQRQQTATRMHAFHIPHWRMNKRPCLFHLDQQLHVKKKLETSQEVRKLSYLEKSRRQYWNRKNSCRTPWIKIQKLGKPFDLWAWDKHWSDRAVPSSPVMNTWYASTRPSKSLTSWSSRRHGELLALKKWPNETSESWFGTQ